MDHFRSGCRGHHQPPPLAAGCTLPGSKSIHSIRKLTDYENYNLYRMDIDYAYDLDRLIDRGITDNQSMINAILAEALPYLPIHMKAPNFGCSAFCTQGTDGHTPDGPQL